MTYRIATMITDNTASGSERLWSEVLGTLVNPVRGFNRIISGEVSKTFPNPEWRRPDDLNISFHSGMRRLDKNGNKLVKEGVEEGVFGMDLLYGNPFKADSPFSNFRFSIGIASSKPVLNKLESSGYLAGFTLKNSETVKHKFNVDLEYGYYDIFKQDEKDSLQFEGILFGATSIYPHLLSSFKIWGQSKIITQFGVNTVLMGADATAGYIFDNVIELQKQYGGFIAYRYAWSEKWRSNIAVGRFAADKLTNNPGSHIKSSVFGFINTFYRLNKYVNVGVEWVYTEKINYNDGSFYNNRFQIGIQVF